MFAEFLVSVGWGSGPALLPFCPEERKGQCSGVMCVGRGGRWISFARCFAFFWEGGGTVKKTCFARPYKKI